jgi:hypothetical protein
VNGCVSVTVGQLQWLFDVEWCDNLVSYDERERIWEEMDVVNF